MNMQTIYNHIKDEFTTTIVRSIEKTQPELLPYQDDMNDTFSENDHQPNVTHAVDNSNSSNTFSTNNEHGSTGTVTTNDSYPTLSSSHFDSVNVTYVILPSEFYLGQTNLITVHSREPRTKLQIFMNLTELSDTIKDESVYKLHRLDVPQNCMV
ncbi:unnamed protein product [Heterobilharzia americana]|nr:unnamed protein product [Heterobilharzia americana]